jgi:N-acyl-L-homoserine lactone synthetase
MLYLCTERERGMIIVINAENSRLFEADLVQMCRQRKIVFIDGAGWTIPVVGDMEMDVYDRGDTIYLLAKDRPDGQVLASVRLLTTTGPHLMCELFDTADREKIPRGARVWEVSRFCTAPGIRGRHRRHALLWETICGVIETGLLYGIDEVIFAASRALLPLALHCGWEARTLGPCLPGDDDEVVAAAAAITTVGLLEMRRRHGIPIPVTRFHAVASPSLDSIEDQPGRLPHFLRSGSRPLHNAWRHLWQGERSSPGESRHG